MSSTALGVLHRVPGVLRRVLGVLHRVLGLLHRVLGVQHDAVWFSFCPRSKHDNRVRWGPRHWPPHTPGGPLQKSGIHHELQLGVPIVFTCDGLKTVRLMLEPGSWPVLEGGCRGMRKRSLPTSWGEACDSHGPWCPRTRRGSAPCPGGIRCLENKQKTGNSNPNRGV